MPNPSPTALGQKKKSNLTWKGFIFPQSVVEFNLSEDAKVATYEYAGRDGAEHERVLNYREISVSGVFTNESGPKSAKAYVAQLRALNNNAPGELHHEFFGRFTCIMKSLNIKEHAQEQEVVGAEVFSSYTWNAVFWEHTDPAAVNVSEQLATLFPILEVRPANDLYETRLRWNTVRQLFGAIKAGRILPGTDPIRNAEWLQYPLSQRTAAFALWTSFLATGVDQTEPVAIVAQKQQTYTVVPGDTPSKIAVKTKTPWVGTYSDSIYGANQSREVRSVAPKSDPDEGLRLKSSWKVFPGDTLLLPNSSQNILYTPANFTPAQ